MGLEIYDVAGSTDEGDQTENMFELTQNDRQLEEDEWNEHSGWQKNTNPQPINCLGDAQIHRIPSGNNQACQDWCRDNPPCMDNAVLTFKYEPPSGPSYCKVCKSHESVSKQNFQGRFKVYHKE